MTGTFTTADPLSRDPERGADAVERLENRSRSPTARVFEASAVLRESPLSLEAVLVGYARRANELDVQVDPAVREDLEQLCGVASEQGYAVDSSRVLERTTPSTRAEALAAARRRVDTPPGRRLDRLATFVHDARAAGIDISMDDFDGTPGMDEATRQNRQQSQHALVGRGEREYVEPTVADQSTDPTPATMAGDEGVYAGQDGGDANQIAVDGGEETTTENDPDSKSPVSKTEVVGPVAYRRPRKIEQGDAVTSERPGAASDRAVDSAVIPKFESSDTAEPQESKDSSDGGSGDVTDEETETSATDRSSGFVWPAADDDVDPDVSPTVRTGGSTDEQPREGPAALVTEDRSKSAERTPSEIHEELDRSESGETPVVRIVQGSETGGGPPDPRALTASLSATGTSVTDALESN